MNRFYLKPYKKIFNTILDFLFPPECPICQNPVSDPLSICPECFKKIKFITPPLCEICGRPFEFEVYGKTVCGKCLQKKPVYDKARSAFLYDSFSKQLILPFKYSDRTDLAPLLGQFLIRAGAELLDQSDLIVPVPLNRWRLMKRKYNQAGILGKIISKKTGIPFSPFVLKRLRATKSQERLREKDRIKNVRNAFIIKNNKLIKNKKILLIDDVLTTGATVNECAKILKRNGAKSVYVLTVAHTLK